MSISFRPAVNAARKVLRSPVPDLESIAVETWRIGPSTTSFIPPAKYLPGQLERIRGTEFGSPDDVVRHLRGGFASVQGETLGFRLRGIDYVEGSLYGKGAARPLRQRERWSPAYIAPSEVIPSASLYETWVGNRWFGNWLLEDCLTWALAQQFGAPVTTKVPPAGHALEYEELLGMRPRRVGPVHFEELILFRDNANNADRRERANRMRERLASQVAHHSAPGVYLLRGSYGMRRALVNEQDVAARLASERGFRVIDPMTSTVREIVEACAGARVVAGVEGSHLVHGLMVMPPDATLLVIQPPTRAVSVLKLATDRQGQTFAFVVGEGGEDEFTVSFDDLSRTLDLLV